ncbi:hypothetical protein I6K36_24105 [Klebsiella pneumoniae]|uniref:hypothetical protein n=1 Tax=Klebsiella pneumoniae TaxID=573 RepID=UPI00195D087A|nr:hypothetical protein [Klebsiella pneumoniae]QRU21677.1 hypothetical protein I6K36_24105 [Klebsiella pneumoniae]
MTDITELAQREKFENWARSQQLSLAYGDCGYFYSSTEMAWRAVKAQSAELVEALEKAKGMEAYWKVQCRGITDHCEVLQARIAELEYRTVTVGNLQESAYRAGLTAGWNLGLANNNDGFNKCLAAHTAGIKVEAE